MEPIAPIALVLGCNAPHGVGVLSDWIEEQTGYAPDFNDTSWSDGFIYCYGDGYGDDFGDGYGEGYSGGGSGYGFIDGDGQGDGFIGDGKGDGYGDSDAIM